MQQEYCAYPKTWNEYAFHKTFILVIKQLESKKEYGSYWRHLNMNVDPNKMKELADCFKVTVHCFDVHVIKPSFYMHYP